MSYRQFQTSQTGGQQYSDTFPFSITWFDKTWQYLGAHNPKVNRLNPIVSTP